MSIFEQASKQKLRFDSNRGVLATEQLWDIPLQSRTGFDLDTIAKVTNAALKATAEESFVSTNVNHANSTLTLKLDILKHIIAIKMKEAEDAKNRAAKKAEKEKLLGLLSEKQDEALKSLTAEQIAARIAALDA
jgi:hypothetical protein